MRDEFRITRQGKEYILYAGLLDAAHEKGLKGIDTELIQVPSADTANTAVVKATVEMEDGRTFGGIGDASPENVGRNIVPHLIRMAETRAKARALRDAVNVAAAVLEELSDSDSGQTPAQSPAKSQPTPINSDRRKANRTSAESPANNGDSASAAGRKARKSQIDLLKTLAVELRGEGGVGRLEEKIGKPLEDLTTSEADQWIDRLTPEDAQSN